MRSDAEIVLVGNELLRGERRDAHLAFIGRSLAAVGVVLDAGHVVGDSKERIAEIVRERAARTRVLLVCGGLGPTHDDVTREGVSDGLGLGLEFLEDQWTRIQDLFARIGRKPEEGNRRQAYFPRGASPLPNPHGTAPGFFVRSGDCLVFVLPGPPKELNPMIERHVLPRVGDIFRRPALFTRTYRTTGIGESSMTPIVEPIFERHREFTVSSLPHTGGVDVVIVAKEGDHNALAEKARLLERELREALGFKVYGTGADTLEAVIGALLADRRETLSVAESLTGGGIGKRMTDVPGSSGYFLCDVVAYDNDAKKSFLNVRDATLKKHGAVSEEVCREMGDGVREKTGSTYGLATTGIAGPGGGSREKPVGLCYYGLSSGDGVTVRRHVFPGGREEVRERVTYATLFLLYETLRRR